MSNGQYYFDGDNVPGTTGWGARNLTVNPTGLSGGTGSGGRIIVDSTWGWNNGNQWTNRNDATEAINITLTINGVTYARLTTPSNSQNTATLSALNGASFISGGGNVNVNPFGQYTHGAQLLLPNSVTTISNVQISGTETPFQGSGGFFGIGAQASAGDDGGIRVNSILQCGFEATDAPSSYGIARHNRDLVATNLRLGANVSYESTNLNSTLADRDSFDDGISSFPQNIIDPVTGAISLTATVTNGSGTSTNFVGWVDWDQDNIFQADEGVAITVPAAGSSNSACTNTSGNDFSCNLDFVVPTADRSNSGYFFSRFRLSTDALTTSTISTSVTGGEVEDYRFCIGCFDISGAIFIDENGDSNITGDGVTTNQPWVHLYRDDDNDGVPSAGDTLVKQQVANNGTYLFSMLPIDTYFVAVAPPKLSGALAEQTYAASNTYSNAFCDANGDGAVGDIPRTTSGACYSGIDGDRADSTSNSTTREHITKVDLSFSSGNQTNVDFGFSYNVVTNTDNSGQGSLEQFIRNANALTGANEMRFVPTVPANDSDGGADWWVVTPTSNLTTITGTNGANTTIDGTAYSNADGTTIIDPNPGNFSASQTIGSSDGCSVETLPALAKPELQIDRPTNSSAYNSELLIVNADNTTVRNVSLTGGSLGINVYSGGISGSLFEQNLIGIDPAGNDRVIGQDTCGTSTGCAGIAIANPSNASLISSTGIIQNNAIKTAHNNISFGNLNGQTATDHWLVKHNQLLGTTSTSGSYVYHNIYIRYGIPAYLDVLGNLMRDATGDGIYQLGTSNVALNQTFISNDIQNSGAAGIHVTSGHTDIITCNVIHNNGGAGVSVDGNTNVDGYLITKNSFAGNTLNAIDLHRGTTGQGVSLNNDACNTDGTGGANNNLARPEIDFSFLTGTSLRVIGNYCGTGTFTVEIYKASSATGDIGSDGKEAGEGLTFLGEVTGLTGGALDETLTVAGLSIGDEITIIVHRTADSGLGVVQDTSEFSANSLVDSLNKDWGDAPDSTLATGVNDYHTLRENNGANHVIKDSNNDNTPDVILGALIDADFNGFNTLDALGDNLDNLNDEDGATAEGYYVINRPKSISVTITKDPTLATATFHLHGWFDWNRDGDWDDPDEHVINETTVAPGTANYNFMVPATAVLGVSYARFRVCSTGDCNTPTGSSIDGEVEDYSDINISLDFGDAPDSGVGVGPDNYRTLEADDGPRHETSPDLYLGTGTDTEVDGLQNATATGDNTNNTNDEDSLTLPPLTTLTTTYNATAVTNNTTGNDAYVYAWLDLDRNGRFDRDELVSNGTGAGGAVVVANGDTSKTLTWPSISSLTNNSAIYLRIRIVASLLTDIATGSDEDPRSFGLQTSGEVEDYRLQVADQDFGDLLDTYKTLALSGGPYHGLGNINNLHIGSNNIDTEADGQPSAAANDDDNNVNDDENAFATLPAPILALTASEYTIAVPVYNNTGSSVNLSAWLDWDNNGQFEAEEYATVVVPHGTVVGNPMTLTFTGISAANVSTAALRLRLSTDSLANTAWGGGASDGEVEDHYIPVGDFDFGDANDVIAGTAGGSGDYRSRLVDNGPYHGIINSLYLGAEIPDADPDAYPSLGASYANGDNDNNRNDENGVDFIPLSLAHATYTARATVNNTTGSTATVHAWIDWDQNGEFEQDEYTSAPVANNTTGTVDLIWTTFTGRITGWTVSRVRITTDSLTNTAGATNLEDTRSLGLASDGEVEDYRVYIGEHDTGDAPNSYLTIPLDGGPCHALTATNTLYLGSTLFDNNLDGQPTPNANGDDIDGVDDEDGISGELPLVLVSDATYSINVKHNNTTGSSATLIAWLDKNQNNQFDANEVFDGFSVNNVITGTNELVTGRTLTWSGLSGQTQGTMALRIRYTTKQLTANDFGGPAPDGEVEDYMVFVGSYDFGDASDDNSGATSTSNYRTRLVDAGPYHGISSDLYIGPKVPDAESDAYNSVGVAMANGDDDDLNGDDEDGVQILPLDNSPIPTSYHTKVLVTNNTGSNATLHGWIDWNLNGRFDGDEHTSLTINSSVTNQTVDLTWTSFTGISAGAAVARFRLTTDDLINGAAATNLEDTRSLNGASDGEVEDHRLYIGNQDMGDAADSFLTLANSLGPFHGQSLYTSLFLGPVPTNEGDIDGQPTTAALGDDDDGLDDEQGINQPLAFISTANNTFDIDVKLQNTTANNATLTAWLDKNQDGVFSANEVVNTVNGAPWGINNISPGSSFITDGTAVALHWSGISGLQSGVMTLRLRLSTDLLTATQWGGQAIDGEVEDYVIYVGKFDFGDASDNGAGGTNASNYRTELGDSGPYHGISEQLFIGLQAPDDETDANINIGAGVADGDDTTGRNDEKGAYLLPLDNSPESTTYVAQVTVTNSTTKAATLHGWVDWDGNGRFDGDEYSSLPVVAGTSGDVLELTWTAPYPSIISGDVVVRLRLTTDTLINSAAATPTQEDTRSLNGASDGEVEDHSLYIGNYDLGDAPDSYLTLAISRGPYHPQRDFTTLYLGNMPVNEGDADGQPSADSLGDDDDGLDDEQAISQPLAIVSPSITTFSIPVRLNNSTANAATVIAWLDKNQDGFFSADEVVDTINGAAFAINNVSAGTNATSDANALTFVWNGLAGLTSGNMALRIRLSNDPLTEAQWFGRASNGEVEDYMVYLGDFDFGDASDTSPAAAINDYQTVLSNNGPRHLIINDLYIGKQPDIDDGTLENATATADDITDDDDEGGFIFPPLTAGMNDYKISVIATNNTGSNASLVTWIDFNNNGVFEDDEGQIITIPNGAVDATGEIEWNNIPTINNGTTLTLRSRLIPRVISQMSQASPLGVELGGEVEDHRINVGKQDMGDAPETYGTDPLNNGPHHIIINTSNLYLGSSNIDENIVVVASNNAQGDDLAGVDDEDGITEPLSPIAIDGSGYSLNVNVKNMTGNNAYLVGWIDANRNGAFEPIEGRVDIIPTTQNGNYVYKFDSNQLTYLTAGVSYIRFRLSTDPLTVTDTGGLASDGEVEDYLVMIGAADLGDLPDTSNATATNNYQTDLINNGPLHNINTLPSLFLGKVAPDADGDAPQSANSQGDDDNGSIPDDEESLGHALIPVLPINTEYQTFVTVTNGSATNAYLYVWIDWNRNGDFEADEIAQQGIVDATGTALVSTNGAFLIPANSGTASYRLGWTTPVATVNDRTYGIRLRVTTDVLVDDVSLTIFDARSLGAANDGEVEDYFLTAKNSDLGDAPDSYRTSTGRNGPYHAYLSLLYLGSANIDNDSTVIPSAASNSDDNTNNDDENGVVQPLPFVAATANSYSVDVSVYNQTGVMATLVAWLDKNQDGAFTADEVVDDLNVVTGSNPFNNVGFNTNNYPTGSDNRTNKVTLTWNNLPALTQGTLVLRIRLSHSELTDADWFGGAAGGEVEDYTVYVGNYDFGDAEDGQAGTAAGAGDYRTRLSDQGPYHGISADLFMGTNVTDAEADAYPSSATSKADGDDDNGGNDEDAVTFTALDNSPAPSNYNATVKVTNNTGNAATLYGWIDFDRNGRFDADEVASVSISTVTTGADVILTWSTIPNISSGDTLTRFRLTTDTLVHTGAMTDEDQRSLGGASDGEVEDHALYIGNYDGGDAPDSYQTSAATGGPAHRYNTQLYLGTNNIDAEVAVGSIGADYDDNTGDDENGLTLSTANDGDSNYQLTADVYNNSGVDAKLIVWVDWDRNNSFDADEAIVINNLASNATLTPTLVTWNTISPVITPGNYYVRARLMASTDAISGATPGGLANSGEVEDHILVVKDPTVIVVEACQNANASFAAQGGFDVEQFEHVGTTTSIDWVTHNYLPSARVLSANSVLKDGTLGISFSGNAANHIENGTTQTSNNIYTNVQFYNGYDASNNPNANVTRYRLVMPADGSITVNSLKSGDEDAVLVISGVTTLGPILYYGSNQTANLSGTFTFNQNDTIDFIFRNTTPTGYTGTADFDITFNCKLDYGDAPTGYPTLKADDGARHIIEGTTGVDTLVLGSGKDIDLDGQPEVNALGDDNDAEGDDETLVIPANITAGTAESIDFVVAGGAGFINVWVDADIDNSFTTDGEHVLQDVAVATGSNPLDVIAPYLGSSGNTFMRVRLCSIANHCNTPTGLAGSGEVDDYQFNLLPAENGFGISNCDNHAQLTQVWWVQGSQRTIIDFTNLTTSGYPTISNANGTNMATGNGATEGTVTITDPLNGAVIVYGDGRGVFNGSTNAAVALPFTTGASADFPITVTPRPGNDLNQFYVFGNNFNIINAGELDFSTSNIINRGTVQNNSALESQLVVPHGNRSDSWLLTMTRNGQLQAFALTAGGINFTPVISTIPNGSGPATNKGAMDYSPVTGKLVIARDGISRLFIGDFNPNTGEFINVTSVTTGIARVGSSPRFSPDGKRVFFENGAGGDNGPLTYYDIPSNTVTTVSGMPGNVQSIKFGPDGRLYAWRGTNLDVIENWATTPTYTTSLTMPGSIGVESLPEVYAYCDYVGGTVTINDFGDAPDLTTQTETGDYRTTAVNNGAEHISIFSDVYLGQLPPDTDDGTLQNITATQDDISGDADEDGLQLLPLVASATHYQATVTVTNNSGNDAYLYAWIDWDNNGKFDKDEAIAANKITINTGANLAAQTLTWATLPELTSTDSFYIRVRIMYEDLADTAMGDAEDPRSYGSVSGGEVEDYQLVVEAVDFGDAPVGYGTLNAYHRPSSTLFLGEHLGDTEAVPIPDLLAMTDDNNASPDDEDGVNVLLPIPLDATEYSVVVEASNLSITTDATLWGWIDWNSDGAFDATEAQQLLVTPATINGQYTLTWSGLSALTPSVSYLRLRLTTDTLTAADWSSAATDGEIEDHKLVIGLFDFGDAPESYGTDRVNLTGEGNGPMHPISSTIFLGTVATDEEGEGFVDGIDNYGTAIDDNFAFNNDEDGVTIPTSIAAQPGDTVALTVHVQTDVAAKVHGWLDFNGNGVFDNATEVATAIPLTNADNNTAKTLNFTVPGDVKEGISYLRVRICADTLACDTPHGLGGAGEVEDYQVTLVVQYDYGDAPEATGYQTLFLSGGPRHALGNTTISLGSILGDVDTDGFGDGTDTNGNATDDDIKGVSPSDEDGITSSFPYIYDLGSDLSFTAICNDHDGSSDLAATVYAWVDFNLDGDFIDAGEFTSQACTDTSNTANGSAVLAFTGYATPTSGISILRMRITTDTLLQVDVNKSASNGEIEDFELYLYQVSELDGGDAPESYLVEYSEGGPSHVFSSLMYLGANDVDGENAAASAMATSDDNNTANDEQGITLPRLLLGATTYSATATVFNNTGSDATLLAWLDSNRNGSFEASEALPPITISTSASTSDHTLAWTGLSPIGYGTYNLRVRLAPETDGLSMADHGGFATNGEVEDHQLTVYDCITEETTTFMDLTVGLSNGRYPPTTWQSKGLLIEETTTSYPFTRIQDVNVIGHGEPFGGGDTKMLWAQTNAISYTLVNTDGSPRTSNSVSSVGDPAGSAATIHVIALDLNNVIIGSKTYPDNGPTFEINSSDTGGVAIHRMVVYTSGSGAGSTAFDGFFGGITETCTVAVARDYGDAPDNGSGTSNANYNTTLSDNGASHVQYDFDTNGQVDITLGNEWDTDDGTLQNTQANADDNTGTPNDEDGVVYSTTMKPDDAEIIQITITVDPGTNLSGLELYAWIDWNRDGDWDDANEQVVNDSTATANAQTSYTVTVPTASSLGYTYMRVRVCSDVGCNTPVGEVSNGEVEDYRIFVSDLNLDNTCDRFLVTKSSNNGASFEYTRVDPLNSAFNFSDIKTGITDYPELNSLAFDRITGMVYGTYINSANNVAIVMTDKQGTSFIPRGEIISNGSYNLSKINGSSPQTYVAGDVFTDAIGSPNTGTLSTSGNEYYITNSAWNSVVTVNLADMTFSIKPLPPEILAGSLQRIGPDWAVSYHDGLIYGADLTGLKNAGVPKLYQYDIAADTVVSSNLNFNGRKPPNFASGAVATDDSTHLYMLTNGGDHDTTGDGNYDLFNRIGMYRINLVSGFTTFVDSSTDTSLQFNDAAGCLLSIDYGDAPESYGSAGHQNNDPLMNGIPNLILGTQWDPDLSDRYSSDATGDNLSGLNDEQGVAIPADIIVATVTSLPVTVTGIIGTTNYLSIFTDLNGNGVFTDISEILVNDYPITLTAATQIVNVSVLLDAAASGGYSGDSFIRFRLCDAQNMCNTPTGLAINGEVEDYMYNLVNQIVLNGQVFEDNGKGSAVAHDGKREDQERGLANFIVKAIYRGPGIAGYVTGQEIIQTITAGDGSYSLVIPVELAGEDIEVQVVKQAQWLDISEVDATEVILGIHDKVTNVSVTDSLMLVTPAAGDFLEHLDFGKVKVPTLEPDNFTETEPGLAVFFSHKFNVNTSGNVSFSINNKQASPSGYNWQPILYFDANCNGELDAGVDGLVINPMAVNANGTTQVCVLVKVIVPNNVPLHAEYNYQLNADMVFSDTIGTGHGVTRLVSDIDTIRVSFHGAGELEIEKTVTNITQMGTESRSNQAQPGDVLEYKIYFINNGSGNIDNIKLFDAIPEYTDLSSVISCTSPAVLLPSSLTCNITTVDGLNNMGYEGGIEWQLIGTLVPAESGYVTYQVTIK
ncbi:GEVED domain-containing protein [Photobacterium kishitanii]|uniref:GEVED domain-containing protein n=1 Tax=Photobacterium kishitanii TaxID=318456 RepID=UPI0011B284E8|nr:GEVED domain-containing protein [Photobacterium kishitanii]